MRLGHIDGLRGIAALAVVLHHAMLLAGPLTVKVAETVNLGRFGVMLFFLISGYVVPFSMKSGLAGFGVSRACRLLPALWLSIGFALVAYGPVSWSTLTANMAMVARPFGEPEMLSVYWTLTYELGFYLACASLFAAGQLHNPRIIGVIAAILALLAIRHGDERFAFCASLFAGTILRLASDRVERAIPWALGVCLLLLLAGISSATKHPAIGQWAPMPKMLGMVLPLPVFLLAIWKRPATPPALIFLGAISYSIYLFQDVAFWLSEGLGPFVIPASMFAIIPIATAVYYAVERPFISLGKRLTRPAPATA